MLKPFLDRWRLCALLASAGMLSIAHAFETFGGYAPCMLCLRQREVYWAAAAIAGAAMVIVRLPGGPRWRQISDWLLAAVFLTSLGWAIYHAGAEWKFWPGPQACSGVAKVSAADMDAFLNGARVHGPSCEDAAWRLIGISMAGWNALISLGLVVMSVLAAVRERGKR